MGLSTGQSARERDTRGVQFAMSQELPQPGLPKPLAQRADLVLQHMGRIKGIMADPNLSIEELERQQAKMVRLADHAQWFAGGTLEQQVQELKSIFLGVGSSPHPNEDAVAMAVWGLAGSLEGAQLGLRLLSKPEKECRQLARTALLSTRSSSVVMQVLQHLHDRADSIAAGLAEVARSSGSALMGLGAIGELTCGRDFEALAIVGSPVGTTPEHLKKVREYSAHANPLVRAAAVRAVGYALFGMPELAADKEMMEWLKNIISNDSEIRVKYRAIALIEAFPPEQRGELLLTTFNTKVPELHGPSLAFVGDLTYAPLTDFLVSRFRKVIAPQGNATIHEIHFALAEALRGKLPPEVEGQLYAAVMEPSTTMQVRRLAVRALSASRDDRLQDQLVTFLRSMDDEHLLCDVTANLRRGCRTEIQNALMDLICDHEISALKRVWAIAALPKDCGIHIQRQLLSILTNEDEQGLLDETVKAFGRFEELAVRHEVKDLVSSSSARENGRAAAIAILGRPQDSSELHILQAQMKEGAVPCRLAALEALCQGGLNGIDGRVPMALVISNIKECANGTALTSGERLGKACNAFLRSIGLIA